MITHVEIEKGMAYVFFDNGEVSVLSKHELIKMIFDRVSKDVFVLKQALLEMEMKNGTR